MAIDGVEGEPVNLTEPVAEAIGTAFAGWLMEKKKADPSKHLRVSVGHDSRITAKLLQVYTCYLLTLVVWCIYWVVVSFKSLVVALNLKWFNNLIWFDESLLSINS